MEFWVELEIFRGPLELRRNRGHGDGVRSWWERRPPYSIWATSHICESGPKYHEVFAQQFGVPWFMLDTLWRYDDESAAAYVRELEELIGFTEQQLGGRLGRDR